MRFQEEDENVKSLRTTDDGRKQMAIAHLSLRLRWAKKFNSITEEIKAMKSQEVSFQKSQKLLASPAGSSEPTIARTVFT